MTGDSLGMTRELQARGSEADQRAAVTAAVDRVIAEHAGGAVPAFLLGAEASALPPDVEVYIDRDRQPTFSMQTTEIRDGHMEATIDTLLDRIVFGTAIFPEDMWQLHNLHEVSRRRSGECGIDVIVASAQRGFCSGGKRQRRLMCS